jgi:hypothetical protein
MTLRNCRPVLLLVLLLATSSGGGDPGRVNDRQAATVTCRFTGYDGREKAPDKGRFEARRTKRGPQYVVTFDSFSGSIGMARSGK